MIVPHAETILREGGHGGVVKHKCCVKMLTTTGLNCHRLFTVVKIKEPLSNAIARRAGVGGGGGGEGWSCIY